MIDVDIIFFGEWDPDGSFAAPTIPVRGPVGLETVLFLDADAALRD
jgi:hypothetical protein